MREAREADGPPSALLRRDEVEAITTLSRSTLYRQMANNEFPKPVTVSRNRKAWRASDIQDWLLSRR
jgi:prophage regulatory protein